jgi:hypothetical protein
MNQQLIGTWKLVSAEYRRANGEAINIYGGNPLGMLMYDADGNVAIQIMRRERPAFAANDRQGGTLEETKAAFDGMLAYFGTYSVDEAQGAVTHHIQGAWFPNWVGVDQTRYFELRGERLTLRTPPLQIAGAPAVGRLVWEKVLLSTQKNTR